ncbi:hypothetical protein E2C01_042599 [Portunus trituberculatus]|uniref:Uncharacterized protein n=1 Tax=Portunus trituberculatus TaxID=210409 RepID=A0A5B7FTG1_PORTR|nr:hypothetical protein [Portunus trituberculatus]
MAPRDALHLHRNQPGQLSCRRSPHQLVCPPAVLTASCSVLHAVVCSCHTRLHHTWRADLLPPPWLSRLECRAVEAPPWKAVAVVSKGAAHPEWYARPPRRQSARKLKSTLSGESVSPRHAKVTSLTSAVFPAQ